MTGRTTGPAIERGPHQIGGGSTFAGTRLPLSAPFEYLQSESTAQEILERVPDVQEWKVAAVLEHGIDSPKTALPGTRIPPLRPGRCPCCGYTGRADRRACAGDASLCRRCRPGNCPRGEACPGPKGGTHPQPSSAGEPD